MPQTKLLTTTEAANVLGVSDETLRRWAREELIRHVKMPSGQIRFRRADLDETLKPVEPKQAS